jgi:hypothetical protein
MIKGVKFVSIPVRNQKAAIEFWTTRVGLQIMSDQPYDDRQRWIELGAQDTRRRSFRSRWRVGTSGSATT